MRWSGDGRCRAGHRAVGVGDAGTGVDSEREDRGNIGGSAPSTPGYA
jgi:hypothetical protein